MPERIQNRQLCVFFNNLKLGLVFLSILFGVQGGQASEEEVELLTQPGAPFLSVAVGERVDMGRDLLKIFSKINAGRELYELAATEALERSYFELAVSIQRLGAERMSDLFFDGAQGDEFILPRLERLIPYLSENAQGQLFEALGPWQPDFVDHYRPRLTCSSALQKKAN